MSWTYLNRYMIWRNIMRMHFRLAHSEPEERKGLKKFNFTNNLCIKITWNWIFIGKLGFYLIKSLKNVTNLTFWQNVRIFFFQKHAIFFLKHAIFSQKHVFFHKYMHCKFFCSFMWILKYYAFWIGWRHLTAIWEIKRT